MEIIARKGVFSVNKRKALKPVEYQLEANEKKALKKGKKLFSKVGKFIKENETFLPVDIGGDCDQLHGEIAQVKKQVDRKTPPSTCLCARNS